jgi:hypothetical protein
MIHWARDDFSGNSRVSTKSQLGVKRAVGLNNVKQAVSKKASKNEETAFHAVS